MSAISFFLLNIDRISAQYVKLTWGKEKKEKKEKNLKKVSLAKFDSYEKITLFSDWLWGWKVIAGISTISCHLDFGH